MYEYDDYYGDDDEGGRRLPKGLLFLLLVIAVGAVWWFRGGSEMVRGNDEPSVIPLDSTEAATSVDATFPVSVTATSEAAAVAVVPDTGDPVVTIRPATTDVTTTDAATTSEIATTDVATTDVTTTDAATTSEIATTDVATTEPATTSEIATTDVATTEPATTEPATTEPATTSEIATTDVATTTTAPATTSTSPTLPAFTPTELPDGRPVTVRAVFDDDRITLTGTVPSRAAANAVLAFVLDYRLTPAAITDELTIDPAAPAAGGVRVVELNTVNFTDTSDAIVPEQATQLDRMVELMAADPQLTVHVVGNTDVDGEETANFVVSQRRAEAVVAYLVGESIEPSRFTTQPGGESDPLTTDSSPGAAAINRRTDFVVFGLLGG